MIQVTKTTGAYAALVSVISGTIVWFNFRPLGLFFFSGLVVFWCRQYANLRLQMTPLVEDKLRNLGHRALQLRNEKPGLFCALISGLLIVLAFIGHVVSGAYIVVALLVLSIVISTKYDIKIVADRKQTPTPLSASFLDQEVEEFLPEITEASASLLKQVGEEADVSAVYKTDSTASERGAGGGEGKGDEDEDDDTYSDLLIPQNSIKELDEEDDEQSSASSSDELLLGSGEAAVPSGGADASSGEIRFKSGHFNANTSSDSDDSISRGLSFDDVPDSSRKRGQQQYQLLEQNPVQQQQQQQQLASLAENLLTGGVLSYLTSAMTAAGSSAAAMSQSHPAPSSSSGHSSRYSRMTISSSGEPRYRIEGDSTDDDGSDFEILSAHDWNDV